jgi:hypothetical protein
VKMFKYFLGIDEMLAMDGQNPKLTRASLINEQPSLI